MTPAEKGIAAGRAEARQSKVEEQVVRRYGCSTAEMAKGVAHMRAVTRSGAEMAALSVLSDAQEMIERGLHEEARQAINRAKYIITEYLVDPHSIGTAALKQ